MAVRSKPDPFPILIVSPTIYLACGIIGIFQVGKKKQSASPYEVSNAQKLDTVVDGKFPNYQDSALVFKKVIYCQLFHSFSNNLYLLCRMSFMSNAV